MEPIGKELRQIIRKNGISFYRISKDLGIAQESLYRSLMDNANPKWNTIKKILGYLGYEIKIVKLKNKDRDSEHN